jgi:hypothetical protein
VGLARADGVNLSSEQHSEASRRATAAVLATDFVPRLIEAAAPHIAARETHRGS